MKFTKQDLLTMLIGLFLFASCKDSNTIGLDNLDPDFEIKGTLVDTATVKSQTQVDDQNTSGVTLIRTPLGFLDDPIFGTTESSIAMSLGIPGSGTYDFGTGALIDSAVLVLPYANQFYGDTTNSTFTIKVNQLSSDLAQATSYPVSKDWDAESTVLGTFTGKAKPNTKIKITDLVAGKPDTLISVSPQIRIKLSETFIQQNIMNLDSAILSTSRNFFKSFKGLKLTSTATGNGGIMFINLRDAGGKVEIYYTKQKADKPAEKDTVMVGFPTGGDAGPTTATIKHNYAGTAVQTQLSNPNNSYDVTYLQAMTGLRNKISFPYLKDFLTTVKATPNSKVIVNKAELVIDLSNGSDDLPFSAAQRLSLYRYDIAGQRANVPDNDNSTQTYRGDPRALGSEILFGGYFDSVKRRYIFTITSYVQDLLDGKTEDYGTFLAPTSLTEFNVSALPTSAARSVVSAYKKNAAPTDKRMRLNIYYTLIN